MKHRFVLSLLMLSLFVNILVVFSAFQPEESQHGIAKVMKLKNLELYIYSIPTRPYDTVETVTDMGMVHLGSLHAETFINHYINRTYAKLKDKPVDGILYTGGNTAYSIKFK